MSDATHQLEAEVASMLDETLCNTGGFQGIYAHGHKYEMEYTDETDESFVFVRQSDGKRFEVEFDVFVRELPELGAGS